MAVVKKRLKLCLYGNVYGAYRSQNLLKLLLDEGYRVAWVMPEFYQERGLKKTLAAKLAHRLFYFYELIDLLIKGALADVIYLLPVNVERVRTALWVARLCRAKLVVEVHVLLYDSLIQDGQLAASDSAIARRYRRLDKIALTQPDYLIDPARYEMDYWSRLLDVELDPAKLHIAPLFTEPTELYKPTYERSGPLRICWWGTLIALHGVETIIAAMAQLQAMGVAFELTLFAIPPAGQEFLLADYQALIQKNSLSDRVKIRSDLRFSDGSLPRYLVGHCDLALGIFGASGRAQATVPTKLIDALSLGLPTLTMTTPALKEFFDPAADLWTCEPAKLAEAIQAVDRGTAPAVDWRRTRAQVLKTFSLETYARVVYRLLDQIGRQL